MSENETKVVYIDENTHTELKVLAAKKKTTIGKVIKELIKTNGGN